MNTAIVTIGRNINGIMMNDKSWFHFRADVLNELNMADAVILQQPQIHHGLFDTPFTGHDQVGVWDGKPEWACTFVFLVDANREANLKRCLAEVAGMYEQEAIGYISVEGDNHLLAGVGPTI